MSANDEDAREVLILLPEGVRASGVFRILNILNVAGAPDDGPCRLVLETDHERWQGTGADYFDAFCANSTIADPT